MNKKAMKQNLLLANLLLTLVFSQAGCAAILGAGAGAAAYEVHSKSELDKLNHDFESGKISQAEYDSRKNQVKKGSVVY